MQSDDLVELCEQGALETIRGLPLTSHDINKPNTAGYHPLTVACRNGHLPLVEYLIDSGADVRAVDQCDGCGKCPVTAACLEGRTNIVKLLLEKGGQANQLSQKGRGPLYYALQSRRYDLELVKFLIEKGSDVNFIDQRGFTPLYVACYYGYYDTVCLLLKYGANVNVQRPDGSTALRAACHNGFENIVQTLLENEADVNIFQTTDGTSPIYVASYMGYTGIVKLLLDYGANVDHANDNDVTPLQQSSQQGHYETSEVLLQNGADVNSSDVDGQTPLMNACQRGHENIAKLLLKKGANIDHENNRGVTPFIGACFACLYELVETYANKKRAMKIAKDGYSALHCTIYLTVKEEYHLFWEKRFKMGFQSEESVEKPVKQKLPVDRPDRPPLEQEKREKIIKLLLSLIDDVDCVNARKVNGDTAFYIACSQGMINVAQMLFSKGADVNLADITGTTPLATAVINERTETVRWLLENNEVLVNKSDHGSHSPLYRACELDEENVAIVKALLDKSADVNNCSNNLVSPLLVAAVKGSSEVVSIVLGQGADVTQVDIDGQSALHKACKGGWPDTVKKLLSSDISMDVQDNNGNTALHLASGHLHTDIVDILLQHSDELVKMQNSFGETPLHTVCCVDVRHLKSREAHSVYVAQELLKKKALIDNSNIDGDTPLFVALKHSNIKLADELLAKGASPMTTSYLGRSLLHSVVFPGLVMPTVLEWIVDKGIDVNGTDFNGQTPLHLVAIQTGKIEHAAVLTQHGADLLAPDKFRIPPICYSVKFSKLFEYLLESLSKTGSKRLQNDTVKAICQHASYHDNMDNIMQLLRKHNFVEEAPNTHDRNHNVNTLPINQADIAGYKAEVLQGRGPLEFAEWCLSTHGQVCSNAHTKTIASHLDAYMKSLSREIKHLIYVKPVLGGSNGEGTKIKDACEFDYVLELEKGADLVEGDPQQVAENKSCIKLRLLDTNASALSTKCGHVSRRKLFKTVYRPVCLALGGRAMCSDFPMFLHLSSYAVRGDDQTIRKLELMYSDETVYEGCIEVDVVPAIHLPNWFPHWCRQTDFHLALLKKHGCRAIAKLFMDAYDDPSVLRLGFAKCETDLLRSMPLEFQEAYKLAKILIVCICPHITEWLAEPGRYITSYHMKTCILWLYYKHTTDEACDIVTDGGNTTEKILQLTRQIFSMLEKAHMKRDLEHFWITDYNLLSENTTYGQCGWCAQNYAALIKWLLEPSVEPPSFIVQDTTPPI